MKNKLLSDQVEQAKRDIKTRYLAGETVRSISTDHKITDRAVYYHLQPLTPEEKATHTKNADLRRMAYKQKRKEEQHEQAKGAESTTETTGSILSDFDRE